MLIPPRTHAARGSASGKGLGVRLGNDEAVLGESTRCGNVVRLMALLVHTGMVAGDAVAGWMKKTTDARAPAK
jgi:hypothetical protein